MFKTAQLGKTWLLVLGALWACEQPSPKYGGAPHENAGDGDANLQQHEQQTQGDGDAAAGCALNQDCKLIAAGCCASCDPTPNQVRAVPVETDPRTCDALCGACATPETGSIRGTLRAVCAADSCQVVDVRQDATTACRSDDECEARPVGCCAGESNDPSAWVAIRKDARDSTGPECSPIPPCAPPQDATPPVADCADDGHCAIRYGDTSLP